MIILDTSVLSALMRDMPEKKVVSWLDRQPQGSIWTTSITILEIHVGLQGMPVAGQAVLLQQFERLLDSIYHRIAVFGEEAARLSANITVSWQKKGIIGNMRDAMIGGIVLANQATLATRKVAQFSDIAARVVNPWVA